MLLLDALEPIRLRVFVAQKNKRNHSDRENIAFSSVTFKNIVIVKDLLHLLALSSFFVVLIQHLLFLLVNDLWSHVSWSTLVLVSDTALFNLLCSSVIDKLDGPRLILLRFVIKQDILRFQISMDDVLPMHVPHSRQNLLNDERCAQLVQITFT